MYADVVRNMVDHLNQKPITLSSNDARAWKLTVDCQDALGVAQAGDIFQCYLHICMYSYYYIKLQKLMIRSMQAVYNIYNIENFLWTKTIYILQ